MNIDVPIPISYSQMRRICRFVVTSKQRRHPSNALSMSYNAALQSQKAVTAYLRDSTNAGVMLGQRRRRWTSINPALVKCLMFVDMASTSWAPIRHFTWPDIDGHFVNLFILLWYCYVYCVFYKVDFNCLLLVVIVDLNESLPDSRTKTIVK